VLARFDLQDQPVGTGFHWAWSVPHHFGAPWRAALFVRDQNIVKIASIQNANWLMGHVSKHLGYVNSLRGGSVHAR
jgi:hypothetical protein